VSIQLFPGTENTVDQTFLALTVGSLQFPRLNAKCVSANVIGTNAESPIGLQPDEDLLSMINRVVQTHALKFLPSTLFIMV